MELVKWREIRGSVKKVNPYLCNLIDKIDPSEAYPFIRLKNLFGDLLVSKGSFSIELDKLKNLITYSTIPLTLVLDKTLEVFVINNERIIPLNIIQEGGLIGLFETIDSLFGEHSNPPWWISSGARFIFLLPRVPIKQDIEN